MILKVDKIVKTVAVFGLGLLPLSPYLKIPGLGLSLDRLLLLILIGFVAINLHKVAIRGAVKLSTSLAYLLTIVVLLSFLINEDSYVETFLAYNYYLVCFVFSLLIFCYEPNGSRSEFGREVFYRVIVLWAGAAIVFSGWAFYNQFVLGQIIYPSFLDLPESSAARYRSMMAGFRLFLPFPTAPHLGFMCLGIVLVLIIDLFKQSPISIKRKVFLICVLLAIALATQSRSSLYAFVLSVMVLFSGNAIFGRKTNKQKNTIILSAFVLLVAVSLLGFYFAGFNLNRLDFDVAEIVESRHASIRLDTINIIFLSGLSSLVFGHGVGTLLDYNIAPYTFTSYLTAIYEIGIFGAVLYLLIVMSPLLALTLRAKRTNMLFVYDVGEVSSLCVFVFLANLFYEFKLLPVSAVLIAYVIYMAQLKLKYSQYF